MSFLVLVEIIMVNNSVIQMNEAPKGNIFLICLKKALEKVIEFMVFAIQICPVLVRYQFKVHCYCYHK